MKRRIKDKQSFAILLMMLGITVCVLCLLVELSGAVHFGYLCVAADSDGKIYLGVLDCIEVYSDGILERRISLSNTRMLSKHFFTVRDDRLYIQRGNSLSVCDLYGNELERIDNASLTTYFGDYRTHIYLSDSGDTFSLYNFAGRNYVTRVNTFGEKSVVFRQPLIDVVVKVLTYISFGCFFFGVVLVFAFSTTDQGDDWKSKHLRIPAIDEWISK